MTYLRLTGDASRVSNTIVGFLRVLGDFKILSIKDSDDLSSTMNTSPFPFSTMRTLGIEAPASLHIFAAGISWMNKKE